MMTEQEIQKFADAYANNVACVSRDKVLEFVRAYNEGILPDYSSDYTTIMDALGMWFAGARYALQQMSEVL
jgi:hypothetical protein